MPGVSAPASAPRAGKDQPGKDDVPPAARGSSDGDVALLAALLDEAPIGFAFIDPELRLRQVSRMLAGLASVKAPAREGRRPSEVWPAALAGPAEAAVPKVLASGAALTGELVILPAGPVTVPPQAQASAGADGRPGGEPDQGRRLALSWYPAAGPDGAITGVAMIAVDVTGERAAARAVRQAQERYRSLVQAGNQVVWVTSAAGEITEDAPEWRWITGQPVPEYLAGGWLATVHPDDRERIEAGWLECLRTGAVFDATYRIRTKTGSYRYYDVRAVPIERDGAVVEWMGANTDVTGQREADEMRGRLTEQLSAAALRTSRLQQATSMLAEALTVEQVVNVITEVGESAIGADRSAVAIVDPCRLRLRVVGSAEAGAGAVEYGTVISLNTPSVMTAVIASRRPLILPSPESLRKHFEDSEPAAIFPQNPDERAWAALPLTTSGAPTGALLFSFTRPRQITDEERVFLEALAGQCALAIERAVLYEREHRTAETLQRNLLPDSLPIVPGFVLRARYKPVATSVGGDWYDAFRLPDGRLAVAIGDVMGKGLTAAAGMGRVRSALRALALTDPRPAAVLAGLDRLFIATENEEQVTTVCYFVVDPATGEGVAGNAGHLPPLRLAPGREPWLDPAEAGTPLGWASPRRQYPFQVPLGSTVVLYSDGLVETRTRGLDVGLRELAAVAGRAPADVLADPGLLIDYLMERMLAGYTQDDDVTVLVLQSPLEAAGGAATGGTGQS